MAHIVDEALAVHRPSMSLIFRPASATAARAGAGQQFHVGEAGRFAAAEGGDAGDGRAAAQGFQVVAHRCGSYGVEQHQAAAVLHLHARLHALADAHLVRGQVLDAAHQAHAFVEVDQRHIEVAAVGGLAPHRGHGIDGAAALRQRPFQRGAAAVRAELARKVHMLAAAAAALDQEAARVQLELVEGLYALGFSHDRLCCMLQTGSQLKTRPTSGRARRKLAFSAGSACSATVCGVQPSPRCTERTGRGWLIRKISLLRTAKIWPVTSLRRVARQAHRQRRDLGRRHLLHALDARLLAPASRSGSSRSCGSRRTARCSWSAR